MQGWASWLALGAALFASGAARAQSATCDVPVIQATHGHEQRAPNIDPRINRLESYLRKAPFTAWHEFKLLERQELTVQEKATSSFTLPNGHDASLTFLGHTSGPGDHRMRLQLVVEDKAKGTKMLDTTFVLDEGGVVLLVGQKHQGGVLILGVSCKTQN